MALLQPAPVILLAQAKVDKRRQIKARNEDIILGYNIGGTAAMDIAFFPALTRTLYHSL